MDWSPTADYRLRYDSNNKVVLQRRWIRLIWPYEPYREKGEEIVEEKWEDVNET